MSAPVSLAAPTVCVYPRRVLSAPLHRPIDTPLAAAQDVGNDHVQARAEELLRSSERPFELIVDNIPGLVFTTSPNGELEFVNRRVLEYFGRTLAELKQWARSDSIHPDDVPSVLAARKRALDARAPWESPPHRLRRSDGTYRWFIGRTCPVLDADGRIVRWYSLLTDIEDRKRAEDALRASEDSLRRVVDGVPGFVFSATEDGEIEFVNQQLMQYTGRTLEELKRHLRLGLETLQGKRDWTATNDLIHPDDLSRAVDELRRSIETGQPPDVEHRVRGADGQYRWFNVRRLPERDADGRIVRWYLELFDIDDLKTTEERLRRSEADLLEAQGLTHTAHWKLDVASGTVTVSPEALRMYATTSDAEASHPEFWFSRVHAEDRQRVQELFERCLKDRCPYEADYRIVLPDGSVKYHHAFGRPIVNRSGELIEFGGTTMDVTEHVQARMKLENAFEEIKRLKDRLQDENLALKEEIAQASMFEEIVGASTALRNVLALVVKVAPTNSSVLITGETGTGKELIARAIHKRSPRADRAFVSVNCAALPSSLISSELFGHEKGAFTGATQRRAGRFELAHGGTLFLDEVGDLPPDVQIALLRVVQEKEFERVGGTQCIRVDVRVIAATNRDLEAATASGAFRSDLLYRLNVFPIDVPPLRERKDDVLLLLQYFVRRFATEVGKTFDRIDKRTIELFQAYDWPGNIRELQNVIERSVIVSPPGVFRVDDAWLSRSGRQISSRQSVGDSADDAARERKLIEAALAATHGRVSGARGAAAKLRIPPTTLDYKIKRLRIRKSQFKLS
jgi:PAS domain S-box-containing protein